MGVTCQINVKKSAKGFYYPGEIIRGAVKYIIDEETAFTSILLSLKGKGNVNWSEPGDDSKIYFTNSEVYVAIHNDLLNNKSLTGVNLKPGLNTSKFCFNVPNNVPSSYKNSNCKIAYYIEMKFVKQGIFNSVKKFKSYLTIISPIQDIVSESLNNTTNKS